MEFKKCNFPQITIIYFMKYFIIFHIYGTLSHIQARFFSLTHTLQIGDEAVCIRLKIKLYTCSCSIKEVCNFEICYRDTGESFREELKEIFSKIDQNIYRSTSKSRILVWVTSHPKIYLLSRKIEAFLQKITLICTLKNVIRQILKDYIKKDSSILITCLSYKPREN